jgi:GTP-binding protein EngB required for normal cell division
MGDEGSSLVVSSDRIDADLARIAEIASEVGVDSLVTEVADERHRLVEARFFVACIGQFKRGKSTLLNALVGHPILPVGVVPVTSVITILREGRQPRALVRFASGRIESVGVERLAEMVDERLNPENVKGVTAVEVFLPSAILANGLCLVDTPGIGSVFEGNTQTTRTFLPHIDVALLVVGPDHPVSADELEITERVSREGGRVLLALNKADQSSQEQRSEVLAFTKQVIERRLGRGLDGIFEISALERAREANATRDWGRLEETLRNLATTGRAALVAAGVRRARRRFARRLIAEIDEQDGALRRPLQETAARTSRLRAAVADVDRSLRDLQFLFGSVESELAPWFEHQRIQFTHRSTSNLVHSLRTWIQAHQGRPGGELRRAAYDHVRVLVEQAVSGWAESIEPEVVALYRKAASRFVELGNEFIARVSADASGMSAMQLDLDDAAAYERPHFYFTSLMHLTAGTPITWLLDRLGPRTSRERSIFRHTAEYLTHLLESNSHRAENDFRERTGESRRQLEQIIRSRLTDALASAERALSIATASQQMAHEQLGSRLARLAELRVEVNQICAD